MPLQLRLTYVKSVQQRKYLLVIVGYATVRLGLRRHLLLASSAPTEESNLF